METLAPGFELRVLRLEHLGAGLGMLPIEEAVAVAELELVVVRLDLLHLEAFAPREKERRLGAAVVLDMALSAGHRAHLLARGIQVRMVRANPLPLPPLYIPPPAPHP